MSTQTLKVTMNKILVRDNGESPGKGELYWNLMVDSEVIDSLDSPGRKVGDGEVIVLQNSATVVKAKDASLTVYGTVSEKDDFLKGSDDTASFKHVYTAANDWGLGSHTAKLGDGKHLDVSVYYTIAKGAA